MFSRKYIKTKFKKYFYKLFWLLVQEGNDRKQDQHKFNVGSCQVSMKNSKMQLAPCFERQRSKPFMNTDDYGLAVPSKLYSLLVVRPRGLTTFGILIRVLLLSLCVWGGAHELVILIMFISLTMSFIFSLGKWIPESRIFLVTILYFICLLYCGLGSRLYCGIWK